ncbi:MAG: hypothetical protein IKK94_03410, partial [Clostridia bacterium]|nr:hypothetical protein [Clostridia bacterium]
MNNSYQNTIGNRWRGYFLSAYGIAVKHGFIGNEEDWLLSLTAYGIALKLGFEGTQEEWIASLKGEKGDPFKYEDFTPEQLEALKNEIAGAFFAEAEALKESAEEAASNAEKSKEAAEAAEKEAKKALGAAEVYVSQASTLAVKAGNHAAEAERQKNEARSAVNEAMDFARFTDEKAASAAESAEIAKANTADIKKQCANALRGKLSGASVSADDVSPIEHELDLKMRSKNIISYPYLQPSPSLKPQGLNIVYGDDGGITISGKNTKTNDKGELALYEFPIFQTDILLTEKLFVSGCPEGGSNSAYRIMITTINPNGDANYFADDGNGKLINEGYTLKNISIRIAAGYDFGEGSVTFYPQVEYGTTATAYTPYIDVSGVNVTVSDGENTQTGTADA